MLRPLPNVGRIDLLSIVTAIIEVWVTWLIEYSSIVWKVQGVFPGPSLLFPLPVAVLWPVWICNVVKSV